MDKESAIENKISGLKRPIGSTTSILQRMSRVKITSDINESS